MQRKTQLVCQACLAESHVVTAHADAHSLWASNNNDWTEAADGCFFFSFFSCSCQYLYQRNSNVVPSEVFLYWPSNYTLFDTCQVVRVNYSWINFEKKWAQTGKKLRTPPLNDLQSHFVYLCGHFCLFLVMLGLFVVILHVRVVILCLLTELCDTQELFTIHT